MCFFLPLAGNLTTVAVAPNADRPSGSFGSEEQVIEHPWLIQLGLHLGQEESWPALGGHQ